MVTISCPWCEQQQLVSFSAIEETEASFTCLGCGTSVQFVDEPKVVLEQAA